MKRAKCPASPLSASFSSLGILVRVPGYVELPEPMRRAGRRPGLTQVGVNCCSLPRNRPGSHALHGSERLLVVWMVPDHFATHLVIFKTSKALIIAWAAMVSRGATWDGAVRLRTAAWYLVILGDHWRLWCLLTSSVMSRFIIHASLSRVMALFIFLWKLLEKIWKMWARLGHSSDILSPLLLSTSWRDFFFGLMLMQREPEGLSFFLSPSV